jgi:hypothetical protein
MLLIAVVVPRDERAGAQQPTTPAAATKVAPAQSPTPSPAPAGYRAIVGHPLFLRTAPLGFFLYGGLIAVQSLWAGPWLTRVTGVSPDEAARGLFTINLAMLLAFMAWGALMPRLMHRGVDAVRLITWGVPVPLLLLFVNVGLGGEAGAPMWAAWCVGCTFVSVSQPAVGAAFPPALAGRALSAFNLVIFSGVFCIQWGIGLAIDALRTLGADELLAYRLAFAGFGICCVGSYAWFLRAPRAAGR